MTALFFEVFLNRRKIDTLTATHAPSLTRAEREDEVRRSLISHDSYHPDIVVRLADRITEDEYDVEADYGHGWEVVTCEPTRRLARERVREYQANEPGRYRIVHHRVRR